MKGGNDEMLRHDPAIANLQNRVFNFQIVIIKDLLRKKFLEITEEMPVILGWARHGNLTSHQNLNRQIIKFCLFRVIFLTGFGQVHILMKITGFFTGSKAVQTEQVRKQVHEL